MTSRAEEATTGQWCTGSDFYVHVHAEKIGPDSAPCPVCGRMTRFHRITGRFARHHNTRRTDQ